MSDVLQKILEHVFEDVPYSKSTQEAGAKLRDAIDTLYQQLRQDGKTELQALGEVLCRCGTPEKAAALAALPSDTLQRLPENAITEKSFRRRFFRIRLILLLAAFFLAFALCNLLQGLLIGKSGFYLMAAIEGLLGILLLHSCRKNRVDFAYDRIVFQPKARGLYSLYLDRFKKRTINSFLLLMLLAMWFVSVTWERQHLAQLTVAELLALIGDYQIVLKLGITVCLKNVFYTLFLLTATDETHQRRVRRYLSGCAIVCFGFLAISLAAVTVLLPVLYNPFLLFYGAMLLFTVIFAVINYRKRATIVLQNLRINRIRIAAFAMAGLVLWGITYMKADRWVLQPYIMTIGQVPHTEHEITYNNTDGVYTIHADNNDFKILHLTDIHIGGSALSSFKDYKALDACCRLIRATEPDLVLVTGDLVFPLGIMSFSLNNEAPVLQFAAMMRNLGVPWAFTYGNHDTESMASGNREKIGSLYESLAQNHGGKLLYPETQPEITGRNNQMLQIENPDGTLRQVLFLLDSNDYTGLGINDYDYIHEDQVAWYAEQVRALPEGTRSMLFFHIPLQEYAEAYTLLEQGSNEVTYHFGMIGETMINPICCSSYPSSLFTTAEALGSTQAMFCGHDHYNNLSVTWRGIRLTYGMSIDYLAMPGIDRDMEQRGGELISIHQDGSYDLTQLPLTAISAS